MAPRRKKVGMKRIDAAIDALLPCGFTKETIVATVNKLLKVYDDDAAWHVIEEDSYKLVLETILDDQEQDARQAEKAKEGTRTLDTSSKQIVKTEQSVDWKDISCTDMNHNLVTYHVGLGQSTTAAVQLSQPNQIAEPQQKRRPCYGWISESEDEDEQREEQDIKVQPFRRVRKRPSGWDLKPSDM
ncbi:uncharacterized protein LOC122017452 [Zingiber officinale]|uniref:uncharacterized protein LOC122017452 n=1 Tax=Zingiber officinale TaxID=94328 RepID=UPI001C4BF816|nr:uncharacterized protein LOC122017452 [Zingiber officinale]XP_042431007.1 uncharacterized protein LOC122017452 [Zingiber officinale]